MSDYVQENAFHELLVLLCPLMLECVRSALTPRRADSRIEGKTLAPTKIAVTDERINPDLR